MSGKRLFTRADLVRERRNAQMSQRTVLETLALYENDPRPLTEIDAQRVTGLEEILRVRCGHGAELERSHHQARRFRRGRHQTTTCRS